MINNDSIGYPKYNLAAHDTVYWAVGRVAPSKDSVARGTSMYFSIRGLRGSKDAVVKYETAKVEKHSGGYYAKEALARWEWNDSDETKWGSCAEGACCR
jgi:hypothetical protein